ncbi:unnamed protein product [Symbiodinium sp. KB8]|nr:unnamed protein product [Symbiodinium sp. KB8]
MATINVRTSTGQRCSVEVADLRSSVLSLKQQVRGVACQETPGLRRATPVHALAQLALGPLRDTCIGKTLRLIFMGKVLDDAASLESAGVSDAAVMHAVASTPPPGTLPILDAHGRLAAPQPATAAFASGAAPGTEAQQGDVEEGRPALADSGFGRLRALGMTDEGIGVLRANYYGGVQEVAQSLPRQEGESDEAAGVGADGQGGNEDILRRLAGRRGGGDDEGGDGEGRRVGTVSDFLCGFVVGYFAGFLALCCIFSNSVSQRAANGIRLGFIANLLSQLLLPDITSPKQSEPGVAAPGFGYPTLRGGSGSELVIDGT